MEDNFTNQEEHLRSLSENFSLEIDTSELWDNIESKLPPVKEERKRPIVWWFATGALVMIVALLVWNSQTIAVQNEISAEVIAEPIAQSKTIQTENIQSEDIQSKNIQSENTLSTDTNNKHTQNSPNAKEVAHQSTLATQTLNNPKISTKKIIAKKAETRKIDTGKENFVSIFNSNRYDDKSTSRKDVLIDQSATLQNEVGVLINPSSVMVQSQKLEDKDKIRTLISLESLESSAMSPLKEDSEYDFSRMIIKPIHNVVWLPYYSITSGVNMNSTNIYTNNTEGLDLTQFDKERSLLGYTTDLQFGYESSNGWRFGFGLNYNRIVNRFSQNETDTIISQIDGNLSSKIDEEGNISYLDGSVIQTSITNYDLNWHRRHDILNAQLSIGKRIFKTGRVSIFTDATIGRSIWSSHNGYYFKEGDKSINKFDSNESNPYSNTGYNAGLSMDLEYELNNISITLKPFARMGLNSITQNSNYYQLKNSLYGIQLGIVYRP